MDDFKRQIQELAQKYAGELNKKISERMEAMKKDDTSHYLIYQVLGIDDEEGYMIDLYQNRGRFLYKYADAAWDYLYKETGVNLKHILMEIASEREV